MQTQFKTYLHNPPHLFVPNAKYFITGATLHKIHYFTTDEIKEKIRWYMFNSFEHFNWQIDDWVILENHYHIVAQAPEDVSTLAQMMNNFHRFGGLWVKKHLGLVGQDKILHNYWDTCIRNEKEYYGNINYLWFNPVKHKYTDQAENWIFGSFRQRNQHEIDNIKQYPFDDLDIYDDF